MTVSTRSAANAADRAAAYAVRHRVFVEEQGVAPAVERDDGDAKAVHVIAVVDGEVVGAGRLVDVRDGSGRVGRMAVLPGARGRGVGTAVLRGLETAAAERALRTVTLHAQLSARSFYERLGYAAYGAEFAEAGIRHVAMRRALSGSA